MSDRKWFQAVAELETCRKCGKYGVQVAHRNEGKAMSRKAPACWTAALCPECHVAIDSGKDYTRDERRKAMDNAILDTIRALFELGRLVIK